MTRCCASRCASTKNLKSSRSLNAASPKKKLVLHPHLSLITRSSLYSAIRTEWKVEIDWGVLRESGRERARDWRKSCWCTRAWVDHKFFFYFFLYMGNHAGGRMDFTRGKSKPISASLILQALSCRFFGCNLLVFVFLAFRICLCFI